MRIYCTTCNWKSTSSKNSLSGGLMHVNLFTLKFNWILCCLLAISVIGFEHADRIAIDHSSGNVYYSAIESKESKGYIRVVHKTASLHKTVLPHLVHPRDIVLHPSKGYDKFYIYTSIGQNFIRPLSFFLKLKIYIIYLYGLKCGLSFITLHREID